MKRLFTAVAIVISFSAVAQQAIQLSDIWQKYSFYASGISGLRSMNDGAHYTSTDYATINKFSYRSGEQVGVILTLAQLGDQIDFEKFDDYAFSADESKVLLSTETHQIFRRSSESIYWLVDLNSNSVVKLRDEKVRYATYSPDGKKIAYVFENNLWVFDIASGAHKAITHDGENGKIINGATDWVYEEEFALVDAFWWSPNSQHIGFFRFDESNVHHFDMDVYGTGLYPYSYEFKYPKAGEDNSVVTAHLYSVGAGNVSNIDLGSDYEYLPRATWTKDNKWVVSTMNRLQNDLRLYQVNAESRESVQIYQETDEKYLEINDELHFRADGSFIMLSDRDGWNHLYHMNANGTVKRQITKGDYNVTKFYGIDKRNRVFYQSTEQSPMERHVYRVSLTGSGKKLLTPEAGSHNANFTKDFSLFVNSYSADGVPTVVKLRSNSGKELRVMKTNPRAIAALENYEYRPKEFFTIKTADAELNAWMIKPVDFDSTKTYPMFMFVYGGPGSQTVRNSYDAFNGMWFQMLANQMDMIVVSVENRGTDGRSESFKKSTYGQMGLLETQDQTNAAIELGKRSYIDASRIGIFGWSYGGYMSSNCLFQSPEVFKMAIAVAPVTNWRFYDNIYTERYMGLPADNGEGYDANSPLTHVEGLEGNYLLIHGTGDDNVHVQNSMRMVEALIQADKDFQWFAYPDKNHGIYGGNTRMHLFRMMTEFIAQNL